MKTSFEEYAYENALDIITTTEGMNGYPRNLKNAVSGFDSFEEAKRCARETGGTVCLVSRRDGHEFWKNCGLTYGPIEISESWFDDDTKVIREVTASQWWGEEYQVLKDTILADSENTPTPEQLCDIISTLQAYSKLYDRIDTLGDNEQIYYPCGHPEQAEVIPIHAMKYHDFDVTDYTIAVCDAY
jgi:hypothetical protein